MVFDFKNKTFLYKLSLLLCNEQIDINYNFNNNRHGESTSCESYGNTVLNSCTINELFSFIGFL